MKTSAVLEAFKSILSTCNPAYDPGRPEDFVIVVGHDTPSGVPDQPDTTADTLRGARNRASRSAVASPDADFSVGLEGGVRRDEGGTWCIACMAVYCPSDPPGRRWGVASAGEFMLPPLMAALVWEGMELGDADDRVTGRVDSKQGLGTVGVLTRGVVGRKEYYVQPLVLAMVGWVEPEIYYKGCSESGEVREGETERVVGAKD